MHITSARPSPSIFHPYTSSPRSLSLASSQSILLYTSKRRPTIWKINGIYAKPRQVDAERFRLLKSYWGISKKFYSSSGPSGHQQLAVPRQWCGGMFEVGRRGESFDADKKLRFKWKERLIPLSTNLYVRRRGFRGCSKAHLPALPILKGWNHFSTRMISSSRVLLMMEMVPSFHYPADPNALTLMNLPPLDASSLIKAATMS